MKTAWIRLLGCSAGFAAGLGGVAAAVACGSAGKQTVSAVPETEGGVQGFSALNEEKLQAGGLSLGIKLPNESTGKYQTLKLINFRKNGANINQTIEQFKKMDIQAEVSGEQEQNQERKMVPHPGLLAEKFFRMSGPKDEDFNGWYEGKSNFFFWYFDGTLTPKNASLFGFTLTLYSATTPTVRSSWYVRVEIS